MCLEDRVCASRVFEEERCKETRVVDSAKGYDIVQCELEKNHPERHSFPVAADDYETCGHMIIDDTTYGQGTALECQLPTNHRGSHNYEELSLKDRELWNSLVSEQREQEAHRAKDSDLVRDAQATMMLRTAEELRQRALDARNRGIEIVGRM